MDTYQFAYRHLFMPVWENVVRWRPTLRRWAQLERNQWLDAARLRDLQVRDLRRLLVRARDHVPYWRELFHRIGFRPEDLADPGELSLLPRLTKQIVRERYADLVDVRTARRHIHKRTSGSTGLPFRFEYDVDNEVWRQAVRMRGYATAGFQPGARVLYYWGLPLPRNGFGALWAKVDRTLRRECFVDCYRQDEEGLLRAVETIRAFRPRFMVGFSVATAILARFILDRGLGGWEPITVLTAAEALSHRDRADIGRAFGGDVFETYGSRETMLIAMECEAHEGLHTVDDALIVELDSGNRPARPGEVGDVLLTDLHNFGMPLIRFENGDTALAAEQGPCACGRGLGRIGRVMGRQSETLRNARGEPIPGMLVHSLISQAEHRFQQVQVVQRADGSVDILVVRGSSSDLVALETVSSAVKGYLKGLPVRARAVEAIEKGPNGKHRCVVVEKLEGGVEPSPSVAATVCETPPVRESEPAPL